MSIASSPIHELAVLAYRRHRPGRSGGCRCGRSGCPARRQAARVLAAFGDDPARYDTTPAVPASAARRG